jgi:tight adherence protein B
MGRLEAAYRISAALGTPLADLIDRVDADLRNGRQLAMKVRAEAAGVQATCVILAGLPLVGVGLGITMGADPIEQLLHTPIGAGCAVGAALLQCAGLAIVSAMVRGTIRQVHS